MEIRIEDEARAKRAERRAQRKEELQRQVLMLENEYKDVLSDDDGEEPPEPFVVERRESPLRALMKGSRSKAIFGSIDTEVESTSEVPRLKNSVKREETEESKLVSAFMKIMADRPHHGRIQLDGLTKFHGTAGEDILEWLLKLERQGRVLRWSDEDKRSALLLLLQGSAYQWSIGRQIEDR